MFTGTKSVVSVLKNNSSNHSSYMFVTVIHERDPRPKTRLHNFGPTLRVEEIRPDRTLAGGPMAWVEQGGTVARGILPYRRTLQRIQTRPLDDDNNVATPFSFRNMPTKAVDTTQSSRGSTLNVMHERRLAC